ncbi:unnamed protein product [Bursaphelenchus xylophilus]|uniref:(pine wood nematode) hypothetical protein n=1 Tax=Bursaphelenchus xylophilus TaxID=6326 RepID=A0A1I7SQ06_BURXY|nr:unnamed protein product [Bursaphelenchus xylophilus]CAG9109450.1 unnamed protein product [Bursaphelenchus xylophilus]
MEGNWGGEETKERDLWSPRKTAPGTSTARQEKRAPPVRKVSFEMVKKKVSERKMTRLSLAEHAGGDKHREQPEKKARFCSPNKAMDF